MIPLTDKEFDETGLPESLRNFAFWDDEGYLVTVHCHQQVLNALKPKARQEPGCPECGREMHVDKSGHYVCYCGVVTSLTPSTFVAL